MKGSGKRTTPRAASATTPLASHLLGRAAYVAGAPIAPATVADALAGVLDRRLFDIDPARRPRAGRKSSPSSEEFAMTAIPFPDTAAPAAPGPAPLRRIVCWMSGAPAQADASAAALALAAVTGAGLTALSLVPQGDGEQGFHGARPHSPSSDRNIAVTVPTTTR